MQKPIDFLSQIFESSRARILRLFVLYDKESFTLSEIARRAKVTPQAATAEVDALVKVGLIKEEKGEGKTARQRKYTSRYSFDEKHKHANALSAFIHEVSPERFNEVEKALRGAGRLSTIVLSGVFTGDLNRPADLIVVGDFVNEKRLEKVVRSFEPKYGREIRYALFSTPEFRYRLTIHDKLIRDTLDYPHRLLLNKNNLI
jgi:DNA-binding MarR family transcriptional regulator